ncbi:MAG: WYL domain-containing protein [Desulfuromonadales bacterium]|nr:WYL domain-containing protein [Desulfuromonadales bacterium]
MSTSYRYLMLLRMIPRYPRKIDTATIAILMDRDGIVIHRRSIQRDLEKLSLSFAITCDDKHKPFGWSWAADAPSLDIPTMSPPVALAYRMVADFMSDMFPKEIYDQLKPHFRCADNLLKQTDKATLKEWPDKVRTVGRSQPLMPPKIRAEVFSVTSDSLLEGKRFQVSYQKRGEKEQVSWTINPLGIVLHDRLITLVCTVGNYHQLKDVRQLQLHRINEATPLEEPALSPDGFNLDEYIAGGAFTYRTGEGTIRLKAVFEQDAAIHLEETPLSEDQLLIYQEDGNVFVEATVADTRQLRWWLLGFGGRIEVLEPHGLREEIKIHVIRMISRYTDFTN